MTALERVAAIPSGACVAIAGTSAEPRRLVAALAERARELDELTVLCGMLYTGYEKLLSVPSVRLRTWFMPGTLGGERVDPDRIDYLPMSWYGAMEMLASAPVDFALIQVSAPDDHGRHSLGTSAGSVLPLIEAADVVLAEVNERMPFTFGAAVPGAAFAATLDVDDELPAFPARTPSEVDSAIAERVADLVPDGATLQVGVGVIPDHVLLTLARRGARGLRVHSMVTEGFLELDRAGALAPGEAVTAGEVVGSAALYAAVDRHPAIRMVHGRETHAPEVLARVEGLVSVTSVLSIDLQGQANTEYLGGRAAGLIGGAQDFMVACQRGGNRSIVALPSTTRDGSASRIVARLAEPAVSLPRALASFVVTEHGVADLRWASERERRERMLAVAHPRFREELAA